IICGAGPRRVPELGPAASARHHQGWLDSTALGACPSRLVGEKHPAGRSDGDLVTRGGKAPRQEGRSRSARAEAGGDLVCALARPVGLRPAERRALATATANFDPKSFTSEDCPEVVSAVTELRSIRPRNADCAPPTDFNLCATEREYSIETARHS